MHRSLSIRAQLLLLVLAIMVPASAAMIYGVVDAAAEAQERAHDKVRILASATADHLERLLRDDELKLAQLARRPLVSAVDRHQCDPTVRELAQVDSSLARVELRDPDGASVCAFATTALPQAEIRATHWFNIGLSSGRLSVSDAFASREQGETRWLAVLSYPVRATKGATNGLLLLPKDLLLLRDKVVHGLPTNASIVIVDAAGKLLLGSQNAVVALGQTLPTALLGAMGNQAEGHFRHTDARANDRLYAFVSVATTGWRVLASQTEEEVFASARRRLWRILAAGVVLLLLALSAAYRISSAMVHPIRALAHTSALVAAGDFSARAALAGPAEVIAVARQLNTMLDVHDQGRAALRESEQRWKFALEGSGEGVWDRNFASAAVSYSERYLEIHGFAQGEIVEQLEAWEDRVHPDDRDKVEASRQDYFDGKSEVYANERRMRRKDGSWRWILARGMVVSRDAQGRPLRMIGTHTDITERHEREESLRLAATVIETVDEAVMIADPHNCILSVNPAFTAITGYGADEVVGRNPRILNSGMHSPAFFEDLWRQLELEGSWKGEIQNRHKSGAIYVEWLSIKRVCDERGEVSHYVAVFSDISERKAAEGRMRQLAHYDVLTGLPNRTLFADRLQQALTKAKRDKALDPHLALLFIDLDKFKPVNDEYGHNIGDRLLKEVASRLQDCVRESDTVARIGGDEFVILLPSIEAREDALLVSHKALEALRLPFVLLGQSHEISASIGIAVFPEHGSDEKSLLKNADIAMYHAKGEGRNNVQMFRV